MQAKSTLLTIVIVVLTVFVAIPSNAQPSYTEDFTTTTYKDPALTTADWNTGDGALKLYPFAVAQDWVYAGGGNARSVEVAEGWAFVAKGSGGFQVYNLIGWGPDAIMTTPGYCWDVAIQGNYAYLADGLSGLQVVDISSPTFPVLTGSYNSAGYAYGVEVDGDYAYLSAGADGIQFFDVSNPAAPAYLTKAVTTGYARNAKIEGHIAWVADDAGYLHAYDVSNRLSPSIISIRSIGGSPYDVDVAGQYAYIADSVNGLKVVDISDPVLPSVVATVATGGIARSVKVSGDRAFVASSVVGTVVFDISDPTLPTVISTIATTGWSYGVDVEGSKLYIAQDSAGVSQHSISHHADPADVGSLDTSGSARAVHVDGDLAYVSDYAEGMRIIDIADVSNPVEVGFYNSIGQTLSITAASGYAYVCDATNGLRVYDVSDPTVPSSVGSYPSATDAVDAVAAGSRLYLSDGSNGFKVLDISNPTSPSLIDSYATTPQSSGPMHVSGDRAYVATYWAGLYIYDISNPASIVLMGTYNTPGNCRDVVVSGNYAYLADYSSGVQILNVSNPAAPVFVGSYATAGNAEGVELIEDRLYVAQGLQGLAVLSVSAPASPVLIYEQNLPGTAYDIVHDGEHLFMANGSSGLGVVQYAQSEWDTAHNFGRSLDVASTSEVVLRARLTADYVGRASFLVSSTGSGDWLDILPDNSWVELSGGGSSMVWWSLLGWEYGTNSSINSLNVEWLTESAHILSIADVPNDQGRQARVEWLRSGHDFVGDASQIVEYAVYRKIEPGLVNVRERQDLSNESLVVRESAAQALALGWDFVMSVPVLAEDHYSVVVPTLADSTISDGLSMSTFRVTALTATPGVFYHSAPDSGYSVDNLAPGVPAALMAAYSPTQVVLDWNDADEADFQYFRVYRDTDPNFVPALGNLVQEVAASGWTDPTSSPWAYYYKVTALDFAGNESEAAVVQTATGTPDLGRSFALHGATPNPFNPSTTIRFELPAEAKVRLTVYDVSGRVVKTLVNEVRSSGEHQVPWNGRDDRGRAVASGVYLYKLDTESFTDTKRMVLVK